MTLFAVLTVLLVALYLAADLGYFRKGRHRGAYIENPEWKSESPDWPC